MGSPIGVLIERERIALDDLKGHIVAIDALNALYQFLSIIRLRDGTPLKDPSGRVTSHLSGLFYRTVNLLEHGIRPVYVFDGKPPKLKEKTIQEREEVKVKFTREWQEALAKGDLSSAFKKSVMTSRLERGMLPEARHLLDLMGIPWVQAPSEGEAQAAIMARNGDCYAAASQDYDSLLFGTPRLIINLTIAGKRYYPKRGLAVDLIPELVTLKETLAKLELSHKQLIDIAMLVGTDFNQGVHGIGPKKALQMIRKYGNLEEAAARMAWTLDFDPERIREFYLHPPAVAVGDLRWLPPSYSKIQEFMVTEKNFDEKRIAKGLDRLKLATETPQQPGLSEWI